MDTTNDVTKIVIVLSDQDLSDYLDGNEGYMSAYQNELLKRIAMIYPGIRIEVQISMNALEDSTEVWTDPDYDPALEDECKQTVEDIKSDMANDLDDFLPEEA